MLYFHFNIYLITVHSKVFNDAICLGIVKGSKSQRQQVIAYSYNTGIANVIVLANPVAIQPGTPKSVKAFVIAPSTLSPKLV